MRRNRGAMWRSENVSNAIPIADDIWEPLDNSRAYYDGYRCRKCGTVIVVEDYLDLPCYCKECEKNDQL